MNRRHWSIAAAAAMMSFALQSGIAWGAMPAGKKISGEITAPTSPTQVEVAHQIYKIKAGSQAAQAIAHFHSGDIVDLTLDLQTSSAVVSIVKHAGS
jgi:hypothetical protein